MRVLKPSRSSCVRTRDGTLTVELIFVLPIVLLLLFGMFELSMILNAREQILHASREGARVAAQGGDPEEVDAVVRRTLGNGRLRDAHVKLVYFHEAFEDRHDGHGDQATWGTDQPDREVRNPLTGRERVEVVVQVPVSRIVPDLLRWAGFSMKHRQLRARTVMNVE